MKLVTGVVAFLLASLVVGGAEMISEWQVKELASWRTRGAAAFSKPDGKGVSGGRCLQIRVPPGAKFQYPQFYREFRTGLVAGDRFRVRVEVRSENVSQDPGAYMAVEFLKGNQRVGIAHSQTGKANGAKGWETLQVDGASLPQGATTMRVSLILHAEGTAWFDNVRVERTARGEQAFTGGRRVVSVRPSDVVLPHFGGVGYDVF